jgi:hypothetical protein
MSWIAGFAFGAGFDPDNILLAIKPDQAARSQPLNISPAEIAAVIAPEEMIGPMPGALIRVHSGSLGVQWLRSVSV